MILIQKVKKRVISNISFHSNNFAVFISLSFGSVLALQTGIQLSGYGIEDKIGGIVGVSLCTELAAELGIGIHS